MSNNKHNAETPAFSSLTLDPSGPPGNAWGRFGPDDSLGMLNLLTPEVVAQAAEEIKTGKRASLDWPLDSQAHPSYGRVPFKHQFINKSQGSVFRPVNDDVLTFNTQSSSQWDGFRHYGNRKHKRYFMGRTQEDLTNTGALGIDSWLDAGGIVGRGVLLDYASWAEKNSIPLTPFSATTITLANLREIIKEQKISFRPGDILIIRSGFTAAFSKLKAEEQKTLSERPVAEFAGVESTEEMLKFLWENQFAAVAGDAPAFQMSPVHGLGQDDDHCLHEWLLAGWGMPIGELFDLEKLSELCKELGRSAFFLSSMPLKVPGGVASPPNAVAIF
ncbi:hypothetical protein BT63DRAFT_376464 [Microthyrium microscopicum]|uniref:Cyclase n=1 Tax=Microthyrium microscopicum TaxID=703497 RepID=A0A6A6U3I2_9PEZI|nr:hypothetical protein BT63DRAFT_376464 [Microthyrium microscopicum]